MTLKVVTAEVRPSQSEIETAWQVFAALSHYRRDNQEARDNPDFKIEMNKAHDRWAALYTAAGVP